jgi:drug/metabolite transporter, DME family
MTTYTMPRAAVRRGLFFVVLAGVFWGTSGVATKALYALIPVSPITVAAYRLALGVPLLLLSYRLISGQSSFRVTRGDLALLLLVGVALGTSQACYFAAIARVGVAIATLVTICSTPVLVGLLAAALLRERLTPAMAGALAAALAGTALLVGVQPRGGAASDNATLTGVLFAGAAAVNFAIFILGSRLLAHRYHPLQSITMAVAIGGALLLIVSILATGMPVAYPWLAWALFFYLGLVPTALGYGLFYYGVQHATAAEASVASLAEPLTGTVLAIMLFGERLSLSGWAGALLLIGVLVFLVISGASRAE